jgi:uncharacterized membrane protein
VLPPKGMRFLIIVVLALGLFFRFVNLDRKVYQDDETVTSMRISGYTTVGVAQQLFDGRVVSVEDLQKYLRPSPQTTLMDTVHSLAVEDPHHPPFYFTMVRWWVQLWGSSVAVTRSLSALISLLVFPCVYWLCLELFESAVVGWVAIALMAVSPFQVLYAQVARQYSLLIVMTLLSSAALLQAMRVETKRSWGIYALTVALGLYSHLYYVWVVISHTIYAIVIERFRLSKTLISFGLAFLAGLLAFTPWIVVLVTYLPALKQTTDWQGSTRESLSFLLKNWVGNLSRIFIDFGLDAQAPLVYLIPLIPLILISVILVIYSIYFLCRQTPARAWLLVVTLIGVTYLSLMLPDLIGGGRRSTISRYLIVSYVGVQLAVAYLLATKLTSPLMGTGQRNLWKFTTIGLLSVGVISCAISSQADTWWNKYGSFTNPQIARIINQTSHPLIVSDATLEVSNYVTVGNLMSLSYLLDPKVKFQLVIEPNIPKIPNGFSDIFLLMPSKSLRSGLDKDQNYKINLVLDNQVVSLWKLVKPKSV